MKKTLAFVAGAATVLLAFACGSSADSGNAAAGSVAVGEACRSNLDCATVAGRTVKCRCSDASDVPVCVTLQKAGESCAITGSFQLECEPGATCMGGLTGSDMICQTIGQVGQNCAATSNVSCSSELTCTDNVCTAGQGTLGATCSDDADCGPELRCDRTSGCAARIAVGASCSGNLFPTAKTCVAGAVCDSTSQKCVALLADGADCFFDDECASGECSFDVCGANGRIPSDTIYGCGF